MSLRNVTWVNRNRLDCAGCAPTGVRLLITATLVAELGRKTIEATLLTVRDVDDLTGTLKQYTFSYDDTQVVSPLSGTDILGVICEGVETAVIDDSLIFNWKTYAANVCGSGNLSYTPDLTNAWYQERGNLIFLNVETQGKTLGAPGLFLYAQLPVPVTGSFYQILNCQTYGPTAFRTPGVAAINNGLIQVGLADGNPWPIGNNMGFQVSGFYRTA